MTQRPQAIIPIQEDEDQYVRILIHGESGIGKTTLAAQSPKCLMLFNDADQGMSAAHAGTKADRWVVQDYQDLAEAVEYLQSGLHDYEWVWLDNASIFQDQGMQQIMEETVLAKPHRNVFVPDKPEYMISQQRLSYAIRDLKSLPMNVGIITHSMDMETTDDDGRDQVKVMPMFQGGRGAFSEKVCGMMGIVGYYRIAEVKDKDGNKVEVRQLVFNKRGRIYAKDRYGSLPDMQNPSMAKILDNIKIKAPKKSVAKKAPAKKVAAKKGAAKKKAPARR